MKKKLLGLIATFSIGVVVGVLVCVPELRKRDERVAEEFFKEGWALYAGIGTIVIGRENGRDPVVLQDGMVTMFHNRMLEVLEEGHRRYPHSPELMDLAVGTLIRSEAGKIPPLPEWLQEYADGVYEEAGRLRP